MQIQYYKKFFLKFLLCFSQIIIMKEAAGQSCISVNDTVLLIKIEGFMQNGKPFTNYFTFKNDQYDSLIKRVDTIDDMAKLIAYFGEAGVITFPLMERNIYVNNSCYSFKSKIERDSFITNSLNCFDRFDKTFKKMKTLFFKDSSQAQIFFTKSRVSFWKKDAVGEMFTYSTGMFFSKMLKYSKSFYYDIADVPRYH